MKDDYDVTPLKKKKKLNSRAKGNRFENKIAKILLLNQNLAQIDNLILKVLPMTKRHCRRILDGTKEEKVAGVEDTS